MLRRRWAKKSDPAVWRNRWVEKMFIEAAPALADPW
jgi:hypothetical protein